MGNFLKIVKDFLTKTFFGIVPGWAFVAVGAVVLILIITLICVSASKRKKAKNAKIEDTAEAVLTEKVVDIIPTKQRLKMEKDAETAKTQPKTKDKKSKGRDKEKEVVAEKQVSEMEKYFSDYDDSQKKIADDLKDEKQIAKTIADATKIEEIITEETAPEINLDSSLAEDTITEELSAVEETILDSDLIVTEQASEEIAPQKEEIIEDIASVPDEIDAIFATVAKEKIVKQEKQDKADALLVQIEEKRKKDIEKKVQNEANSSAPTRIKSVPKSKQPIAVTVGAMSKLKPKTETENVSTSEIDEVKFSSDESGFSMLFISNGKTMFIKHGLTSEPTQSNVEDFKILIKNGNFVIEKNKSGGFLLKLLDENYASVGDGTLHKLRKDCDKAISALNAFCKKNDYKITK